MSYVAPFESIIKLLTVSQSPHGETIVAGSYDDLLSALRLLLTGIDVNEDWYLATNPAPWATTVRRGHARRLP